jgi:hypothetical protein
MLSRSRYRQGRCAFRAGGVIQVKDGLSAALIGNFGYADAGYAFRGLTVIADTAPAMT